MFRLKTRMWLLLSLALIVAGGRADGVGARDHGRDTRNGARQFRRNNRGRNG